MVADSVLRLQGGEQRFERRWNRVWNQGLGLPNVPESHQAACEGYRERWETNDHRDSLEIRSIDLAALGFLLSFQGGAGKFSPTGRTAQKLKQS